MKHDSFEAFGFAEPLSRALGQCGYSTPTPVQTAALPPQIEGRDLLALAETGSGKTAAFVLPILQEFASTPANPNQREALSLILAPTRELALQIDQEVASLSRNMHIRRAVVLGGVSKGPQIHALKRGVHILVATPGRLLDHIDDRHVDLRCVRTFVLDEADRMFDMGFIRDVRKIASLLSHKRRTAMLSATMPAEIRSLAHELLNEPYRIDLSPRQIVVDRIDQKVMIVRGPEKQSRLHTILKDEAVSRVIVFTRTKRGADRVADRLAMAGIGAAAIHGNKAQNARQRALKDFSAGHVRVLVATDIAARGIDVSDITHVINFDMPVEPETYVHRIGRTARKGSSGTAISLCDPSERGEIRAIERLMKQPIEVVDDVGGELLPMPPRRPQEPQRHHTSDRHGNAGAGTGHRGGGAHHGRANGRDGRPAHRSHGKSGETGRQHTTDVEGSTGPEGCTRAHRDDRSYRRDGERNAPLRIGRREHFHANKHESGGRAEARLGLGSTPQRDTQQKRREAQPRAERHATGAENKRGGHQQDQHQERRRERDRSPSRDSHPAANTAHGAESGSRHDKRNGHKNEQPRSGDGDSGTRERTDSTRWNGQRPPKFLNGSQPRRRNRPAGNTSVA